MNAGYQGPVKFSLLPIGDLFRIFSERRVVYIRCEREERVVRSQDKTIYKKHGQGYSSSKVGKDLILSPNDLVLRMDFRKGVN